MDTPAPSPSSTDRAAPLVVVYDADCGVCQASIAWLRRRDRKKRFRFVGNDSPELPFGVSLSETEHTVVVLDSTRKWTRAGAVSRLLRELRPWAPLGWLLRAPGVLWLADRAYDRFARSRHRLSAVLGMSSCELPGRRNP